MITDINKICQFGQEVIAKEASAVNSLYTKVNDAFALACQTIIACQGRVIVMGMGKSGHIAGKISATLASTGTSAFFLHPAEASHGDLGNIKTGDVVIAISNSGNTAEILAIIPRIKRLAVPIISITANQNSALAKIADINLDASVNEEACPFDLAPTSSTTVALVMGDALAITLLSMRGFTAEDFARNHPGGTLGKRLCLRVEDIMRTGQDIPQVTSDTLIIDALMEITAKRMGMTLVIDTYDRHLIGIYTDGDLRRTLDKNINLHTTSIKAVMTTKLKTIAMGTLALEALQIMEQYQITTLVITTTNNDLPIPQGVIHIHDLLKEGIK